VQNDLGILPDAAQHGARAPASTQEIFRDRLDARSAAAALDELRIVTRAQAVPVPR
jgi:hypothetical protein